MKVQNGSFLSIEQLQDQYLKQNRKVEDVKTQSGQSFQEILKSKQSITTDSIERLKFSKHAASRLSDRNIDLTNGQMERLNEGAKKAGEKGIQESLVIVDELAFIVNIPNKTVVTAMDRTDNQDNIFTNIDGAVIM